MISPAFCPIPNEDHKVLDKTQVKLCPNFASIQQQQRIPFDYLYISWFTSYVSNLGFLVDMFILDGIDRELLSLERLELKFGLSSQIFDKIPIRILLDVLFYLFRFSKVSFYSLASSFMTF